MTDKTTYELLEMLKNDGVLEYVVEKGIIPVTLAYHKVVYENYLNERKFRKKSEAILQTSVNCDMSTRQVWNIIKNMET